MQNAKSELPKARSFCHYAGYRLLIRISRGNASVKILIAQGYMALREQNISSRQATVSPSGPITAASRLIICANSPLDCRLIPTCSGRLAWLKFASLSAAITTGTAITILRRRNSTEPIKLINVLVFTTAFCFLQAGHSPVQFLQAFRNLSYFTSGIKILSIVPYQAVSCKQYHGDEFFAVTQFRPFYWTLLFVY